MAKAPSKKEEGARVREVKKADYSSFDQIFSMLPNKDVCKCSCSNEAAAARATAEP